MSFNLARYGSVWDLSQRREQNKNLDIIESFLKRFDGTRLMDISYNLFNKDKAGDGSINNVDGSVRSDGFKNTGMISIKPNTYYTVKPNIANGAFYDVDGKYIKGTTTSSSNPILSPGNASLVRMTLSKSDLDTFMIYEGTEDKPYKPYGVAPHPLLFDQEFLDEVQDAREYFENTDALGINYGKDFPLKSVKLGSQQPVAIPQIVKNVILDAKVSGAKSDMYYRLDFVANGIVSKGKARWGINLSERRISDGSLSRHVFLYNSDDLEGNTQNANVQKLSDGIDTIIVEGNELVVSLTVDRQEISNSSNPTFLNLNSGVANSPSAVIDRSVYANF